MSKLKGLALRAALIALCGLAICALRTPIVRAQDGEEKPALNEVQAHYTKYEFRIPMRDGEHLFTAVYVPKDVASGKPYPILMDRTPYSVAPYGAGQLQKASWPLAGFRKRGIHLRLSGRARAVPCPKAIY